jgi:sugar lactone lactonase YvrE
MNQRLLSSLLHGPAIVLASLGIALGVAPAWGAPSTITSQTGGIASGPATSIGQVPIAAVTFGTDVYIADGLMNVVRKLDTVTGIETIAVGNGSSAFSGDGGPATAATLGGPAGLAVDSAGNLFIADSANLRIRRVDAVTGIITTVAGSGSFFPPGDGGLAINAGLGNPSGVAVDGSGNLYITELQSRVRRVDAATGIITTFAGTGVAGYGGDGGLATSAQLFEPTGVAVNAAGDVFIADRWNSRVRRVAIATGIITTYAGNAFYGYAGDGGPATAAALSYVWDVAFDPAGNLYIADINNQAIRRVAAGTGIITTVAGSGQRGYAGDGGPATAAKLFAPEGVAASATDLFIADTGSNHMRRVTAGIITTVAGNGTATSGIGGPAVSAQLAVPTLTGSAVDAAGNLYFNGFRQVHRIDAGTGIVTTIAGLGTLPSSGDGGPAVDAELWNNYGVAVDGPGNVFISELFGRVRRIDVVSGIIDTVAGTGTSAFSGDGGPATAAELSYAYDVVSDAAGNYFIADGGNSRVRRVDAVTGIITTVAGNGTSGFAGDGGLATAARINLPIGVALDPAGNLFIADHQNNRVRRVDALTGIITTVAGNGTSGTAGDGGQATAAQIRNPQDVTVDAHGGLFISQPLHQRVRFVDLATGVITTLAGTGTAGFSGDGGVATSAQLNFPQGLAVDASGHLFINDWQNNRIRRVDLSDVDADGLYDYVDPCTNLGGGRDFATRTARLVLRAVGSDPTSGDDRLSLRGEFSLAGAPPFSSLVPPSNGMRLVLKSASGITRLDVILPAGVYQGAGTRGWLYDAVHQRLTYRDKTGSPIGGIVNATVQDRSSVGPGVVRMIVRGRRGSYPVVSGDEPVQAIVAMGKRLQSEAGLCGESAFPVGGCSFNPAGTTLRCRRP